MRVSILLRDHLSPPTCYWEILVTLDCSVRQASIEICNGVLANLMTSHLSQSEGIGSVLSSSDLTLSLPQ